VKPDHLGEECWTECGEKSGYCNFCGETAGSANPRACCKQGFAGDPAECAKGKYTKGALSSEKHLCVDIGTKVNNALDHLGDECWDQCNHKGGECLAFYGKDRACCRHGHESDPVECRTAIFTSFDTAMHHTCVALAGSLIV